jgi:hypothetical protein
MNLSTKTSCHYVNFKQPTEKATKYQRLLEFFQSPLKILTPFTTYAQRVSTYFPSIFPCACTALAKQNKHTFIYYLSDEFWLSNKLSESINLSFKIKFPMSLWSGCISVEKTGKEHSQGPKKKKKQDKLPSMLVLS